MCFGLFLWLLYRPPSRERSAAAAERLNTNVVNVKYVFKDVMIESPVVTVNTNLQVLTESKLNV